MGRLARTLQVGDSATTDYNGSSTLTCVTIMEVDRARPNGGGVAFRVHPPLQNGTGDSWYDADWFEPVKPAAPDMVNASPSASLAPVGYLSPGGRFYKTRMMAVSNCEQIAEPVFSADDHRRMAACVKACAGIDTNLLEGFSPQFLARLPDRGYYERQQRDALFLAGQLALQLIKDNWPLEHGNKQVGEAWGALDAAIRKAKTPYVEKSREVAQPPVRSKSLSI